jgi:hypothetical protein
MPLRGMHMLGTQGNSLDRSKRERSGLIARGTPNYTKKQTRPLGPKWGLSRSINSRLKLSDTPRYLAHLPKGHP